MPDLLAVLRDALADRYAVERELGRGGMATVFLAEDLKHRRPVAIKVLHPELAAAVGADRFLREIEIAARLQHPHILPLYDSGTAAGFLYYVMPYVEGESLRDRLEREKQLSLEDTLRIAGEVAGALAYAHSHGVVHRDIKPENVMLSGGTVVVADFGIARAVTAAGDEHQLTQTGTVIGTPAYMSPEQATGSAEIDGRSDQYSLASVVYEMLVGEPPFTGPTAQAVMARHSLDAVSPPSIVRASIPDAVEDALLRALAKTPADRFPTAALFAEALARPSAATGPMRRATRPTPAARRVPRRVLIEAGGAVVILALALGFARTVPSRGRAGPAAEGGLDPRHVAVLYFEDLSRDSSLGYLTDGLTELLISQRASVRSLAVTSRNGVAPYRANDLPRDSIARLLRAGTLVEGSVENVGTRLRVTVRLVDGTSGSDIRRQSFELPQAEVLVLRDSLAREAARFLRERLGEEIRVREELAGTRSVEAWTALQEAERLRKDAERLLQHDDAEGAFAELQRADTLLAAAERADSRWVAPVLLEGRMAQRRARASGPPPGGWPVDHARPTARAPRARARSQRSRGARAPRHAAVLPPFHAPRVARPRGRRAPGRSGRSPDSGADQAARNRLRDAQRPAVSARGYQRRRDRRPPGAGTGRLPRRRGPGPLAPVPRVLRRRVACRGPQRVRGRGTALPRGLPLCGLPAVGHDHGCQAAGRHRRVAPVRETRHVGARGVACIRALSGADGGGCHSGSGRAQGQRPQGAAPLA